MAQLEIINVGAVANDGTGDPLRVAFEKVNNNFSNLWSTGFNSLESVTFGNTTQEIFSWPANVFTQATFQINSVVSDSNDSQNIVINASINNSADSVRFVGHSTTFHGNAVCNYSMDVVAGNVTLYVNPFVTGQVVHYIAYQVTYDAMLMGTPITLEQDANAELLTETTDSVITTES